METVSIKFDEDVLRNIDESLKAHHYSTRTEFIREAVRDKLKEFEKDELKKHFQKYFGTSGQSHVSDERLHEIREEVSRKYAKKFRIKLD